MFTKLNNYYSEAILSATLEMILLKYKDNYSITVIMIIFYLLYYTTLNSEITIPCIYSIIKKCLDVQKQS